MIAAGGGNIVTMSSAFGLMPVPRYSAYCASKFAVRAFTDALRLEVIVSLLSQERIEANPRVSGRSPSGDHCSQRLGNALTWPDLLR